MMDRTTNNSIRVIARRAEALQMASELDRQVDETNPNLSLGREVM
jgi:hypothetical protein